MIHHQKYPTTQGLPLIQNQAIPTWLPDDKKTTKSVLPSLPWSSNSILPESFQSVISQLIEQEISIPGNFILDYETLVTPAIDVNTLVDQSLFLDSEESIKIEFKSHNISGYLDDEYDKNISLSELVQISNTELEEVDNFPGNFIKKPFKMTTKICLHTAPS
ncbi:hypothetical protein AVEN_12799-1 [Araneus ventricosus]|uniref:Uncharacterized protein n=1 Tax=Araneus ventricosus TaxID=182803 RepID=A0A4Y2AD62_ARAVE|nr:hypothetical protein AVEN_12799-1 [Araneus ventricosus]